MAKNRRQFIKGGLLGSVAIASGTFNTVTPTGSYSMGKLLADSQAVAASKVDPP